MSEQHTPGRLSLEEVKNDTGHIKHLCPVDAEGLSILTVVEHNGAIFAAVYKDADARRLAACWNACEGLDTDKLERMPAPFGQMLNVGFMDLWGQYTTLKAQCDEMLEALQACDEAMSYMSEYDIPLTLPAQVKATIAKAGGAA